MEKELLNHGELPADAIEKACCFVKTEEAVLPYSFKTELHLHTSPVSSCSEIPPEEAVKIYAAEGYDALVVTNHFEPSLLHRFADADSCVKWYLRDFYAAQEAGDREGVAVLLGMEIRFTECINDYLVYGVDEEYLKEAYGYLDQGIEKFYRGMHREETVILQAHPFRNSMERADAKFLDGIETFNMHPGHNSRVGMAARYAREKGMIVSAGTDFHHPGHQGMAAMLSKTLPTDSYAVAKILRSRDYLFSIGGCTMFPYK